MTPMDRKDKLRLSRRITLLSLLLLFVSTGMFAILNKEALLVSLLEKRLSNHGLKDLQLQRLQFNGNQISLSSLQFTYDNPTLENIEIQIQLNAINAEISWQNLFINPIKEITVDDANLQLRNLTEEQVVKHNAEKLDTQNPAKLSTVLPYELLNQLPVQRVAIKHWLLEGFDHKVYGAIDYDKSQQTANANTILKFANTEILMQISSSHDTPLTLQSQWNANKNNLAKLDIELRRKAKLPEQELAHSDFFWHIDGQLNISEISFIIDSKDSEPYQKLHQELYKQLQNFDSLASIINAAQDILESDNLNVDGYTRVSGDLTQPDKLELPPALVQFFSPNETRIGVVDIEKPEGILFIENQLAAKDLKNLFSLNITDVNRLSLTRNDWTLTKEQATPKTQNQSDWLKLQADTQWLRNSKLFQYAQELANQKIPFYGASKIDLKARSLWINGNKFTPAKVVLEESTLSVTGSKTLAFDGELHNRRTSIISPMTNLIAQSDFNLRLDSKGKKLIHNWTGKLQLQTQEPAAAKPQRTQLNFTANSPELAIELAIDGTLQPKQQHIIYRLNSSNLASTFTQSKKMLATAMKLPEILNQLDLTQGDLALSGEIDLLQSSTNNTTITYHSNWQANNISGLYDKIAVQGLSLSCKLTGLPTYTPIQTTEAIKIAIKSLSAGVNVSELEWSGQIQSHSKELNGLNVHTDNFDAQMFSGQLKLEKPFDYNFAQGKAQGTLRASAWQLNELVALQKNSIQAQGLLDGDLNFVLTPQGLEIPQGRLLSRPPGGTIRYPLSETQAIIANSPELELAMRMLDNFNYRALSTDIELSNTGELHLGLNLNGMNPTELNGRSVEFNINVDQNILPLLESLRLSDQVINSLEKKIKQHY